jgi:hypothetical protein
MLGLLRASTCTRSRLYAGMDASFDTLDRERGRHPGRVGCDLRGRRASWAACTAPREEQGELFRATAVRVYRLQGPALT